MCEMRAHETEKRTSYDSVSSGGGRPIPDTSTTYDQNLFASVLTFSTHG